MFRFPKMKMKKNKAISRMDVFTAQKTILSFSNLSEKIVFANKSHCNMIFFVLPGKMLFLFPENMILFFRREMKDDIFQKIQLCNCLICIIKTMCFGKTILIVELEKMSYRCLIVEIPPLK